MFTRIFSIPFVLCNLMAPEGAEGGGGGFDAPPPAAPPAEEPKPTGDTLEAKLASAIGHIGNLFRRVGEIGSQLATANGQRDKLQGQFDAASKGWNDEKEAHATTKTSLIDANTQITGLTTERDNANKNVERLETLCQLRGIDANSAVPPAPEAQAAKKMPRAEFEKLTPANQSAFMKQGGKLTD